MFALRFERRARDEIRAAFADASERGVGAEFRAEVEHVLDRLRRMPRMYAAAIGTVRHALLRRSRFAIHFELDEPVRTVYVLAVLPQRADPTRWPK